MRYSRRRRITFFALANAWAVIPSMVLAQQRALGPLTSEEGAPLQRISYTPMMEGADVVGHRAMRADVWFGFSNVFEQDSSATHVLFLDMERLISTIGIRWGASASVEVGGRITLETTGPGTLDALILGWHNRMGFGNANRDRFPEGVYQQRLTDGATGIFLDIPRTTLGFEDVRFFAKWRAILSADERSVLSLRSVVRIPGDSNLAGDERSDAALMALGRLGMGAWYAHVMMGVSSVRASPELEPILKRASTFFTLAFERSLAEVSPRSCNSRHSPRSWAHSITESSTALRRASSSGWRAVGVTPGGGTRASKRTSRPTHRPWISQSAYT